jgi:hypothetical protein
MKPAVLDLEYISPQRIFFSIIYNEAFLIK